MRENILDIRTDKIKARVSRIVEKARIQFKGTNPYRKERIPDEERIMNYMNFLDNPEIEQQMRSEAGDEPVEQMHLNMKELINRRMTENANR